MEFYRGNIPILDESVPVHRDILFEKGRTFGMTGRDWSEHPEGFLATPPSQMKVYDPSEWDALYDEQEERQSSLEHLYLAGPNGEPEFINLDQGTEGFCHTADTEVLTSGGFVPWPEYDWKTPLGTVNPLTHALEFQRPLERHVYEYDGEMIYSTNRRVNFGVTPDHQMYVRKWDEGRRTLSDHYSFVRAADLGWYSGLLPSPSAQIGTELVELEVPGDRRYDGDDFLALLGLVISDGYAGGTEKTRNWVSFASFRESTRDAVAALASRVGFHEFPGRRGVWVRYDAGALAKWLRENAYANGETEARAKRVPDVVRVASARQIRHFLHWFDDRSRSGRQFYSTSCHLVSDLQELHLRIGKRSTITRTPEKRPRLGDKEIKTGSGYLLTVGESDRLCLERKNHIEQDRYKGLVYCAAVPNHTLVTRREGTVLVSSNCWVYSTVHALMMVRLAMGLKTVRLNPHSVGAIIKGGRNEGGWCGLSGKFVEVNGCAEEGNGPGQWPFGSLDLRYDTPELRSRMSRYKVTESWYDLGRTEYDQKMTARQIATCGFNCQPVPQDFMWWRHSVCGLRWVRIERGSWGPLILNSWKGWGRHGLAVLRGSQATADNAISLRVARAA